MSKKILMFGSYPIVNPMHGGQLRARAIYDLYISLGFDVIYVGMYPSAWYEEKGPKDVLLPNDIFITDKENIAPDYTSACYVSNSEEHLRQIENIVLDFEPDIVDFEQLFAYIAAEPALVLAGWQGPIIYQSHNLEYALREKILLEHGPLSQAAIDVVKEITNHEAMLTKRADLVVACTEYDKNAYDKMKAKNTIIAPNGIYKSCVDDNNYYHWKDHLLTSGADKYALFVGSAHPPNAQGFIDLIGFNLGFLDSDSRIIVVGGVCDLIKNQIEKLPPYMQAIFRMRTIMLGRVDDATLASLISLSKAIVLPITVGGGSNLKTAEALLSGKAIVSSAIAMRGYNRFVNIKYLWMANNKTDFHEYILQAINADAKRTKKEEALLQTVTWEYALEPLKSEVVRL